MAIKSIPTDQYHIQKCEEFCTAVESLMSTDNQTANSRESKTGFKGKRLSYIDAVLTVAQKMKIEPDLAAQYINPDIKEKLRFEYEALHCLPRSASLPF